MVTVILRADSISKKYNPYSSQTEMEAASIEIEEGGMYVIKGKSGSGKSTLLNILGGMESPTAGSVYYQNRSLYELGDRELSAIRGKKFGFVFQSFNLIPELTVKENIRLPLQFNQGMKDEGSNVEQLAEELGIRSILDKRPFQISGGEQQRSAIARALITAPKIIFADEPTGSLDQFNSQNIIRIFTKMSKERKTALVMVTHEEQLLTERHHLYTISDGKLRAVKNHE